MDSAPITTLIDILPYQLQYYPQEDALAAKKGPEPDSWSGEWMQYSTVQCIEYVNMVSKGLLELGVAPNDRIAIISENRPEWLIVDNGLLQMGAVNVPLFPTVTAEECRFILDDAQVKLAFVSNEGLYKKIASVWDQLPALKWVFAFDQVNDVPHWNDLLEKGRNRNLNELVALRKRVQPQELATIIYTSGTTGDPRGVMLTHDNIVSNVLNCISLLPVDYHSRALSFLPLNHVFERMLTYLYVFAGVSIYYAQSMQAIGENAREIKPQIFTAVPRVIEKLYEKLVHEGLNLKGVKRQVFFSAIKHAENYRLGSNSWWYRQKRQFYDKLVYSRWRDAFGGELMTMVSGSAPLSPRLQRIFTAAGIPILEGYGLTETSPVVSVNRYDVENRRIGTVGPPIPGCQVKIDEDGEILVAGPNVMKGYYNDPAATRSAIDDNGWFYTGDIGSFDGKFLTVTDRKDDLFKTSSGKFIAPGPIENRLRESLLVDNAVIVGKNRELPGALIVPAFEELEDYCAQHNITYKSAEDMVKKRGVFQAYQKVVRQVNKGLSKSQQIKRINILPRSLSQEAGELTPSMKIRRQAVTKNFSEAITEMYERDNKNKQV